MNSTSNPKKTQILSTGKELFWKFGFKRVTIEEISKAAGVSKMTFYKYFPNKQDLAKTILSDIFEENIQKIKGIAEGHESTDKTLRKIMQLKAESSKNISDEFIKDLYANPDLGLQPFMAEMTRKMFDEIITLYEKGKEDGWIRKDLNIPFFLAFTRKIIPLTSDDEMVQFFSSSQEMIMEITNLFIYGVSPNENEGDA